MKKGNTFQIVAAIVVVFMGAGTIASMISISEALGILPHVEQDNRKAPLVISGDSIYVSWWTNITGNDEVMFRVSTDAGKTFSDKINLSNTPNSDSVNVEIAEDEGKVAVSWWERNSTSNEPVMRISNDNGKTFGEKITLSTNGPIG